MATRWSTNVIKFVIYRKNVVSNPRIDADAIMAKSKGATINPTIEPNMSPRRSLSLSHRFAYFYATGRVFLQSWHQRGRRAGVARYSLGIRTPAPGAVCAARGSVRPAN